ncbi:MAG TPA: hypothetical protein VFC99_03180 [Acidimicrobiia bacterium]|nr:hypothetical protein [Acidimicrobiia bacterium]
MDAVVLDEGAVVVAVPGAVVVVGVGTVVVVDGELPPLSWGPSTQTMTAVNTRMATPVSTAIVTSRRSRLGRYVDAERRDGLIA